MAKKNLSYSEALAELESIVRKLQSGDCDVDELVADTKRAVELLTYCKGKLTTTETNLRLALEQLTGE